jgi:integrase
MTGHIRSRGEHSWEIKFDLGIDPTTGKRRTRYVSFTGTKKEAKAELIRLKAEADKGQDVDPSKVTLAEFLDRWETWAKTQVSAKTLERYKELAAHHVRPHLGGHRLQKLRAVHLAELYGKLQKPKAEGGAGLSARTVGHVHRLLHRVFGHAVKWSMVANNPVASAEPPAVERTEIEILSPDQIKIVLQGIKGRSLYPVAVLGLATGMRRGELVALRWKDVDLDGGKVRVERSLEQTRGDLSANEPKSRRPVVLRFKSPKTKAGRRIVTIPPSVVLQQEQRLAVGLGGASGDDLVFARYDGSPYPPDALTWDWARTVRLLKLPLVTFHALRHTHASQLIASGLDVVSVSRRLGHSNPTVTLGVYAHLFGATDERAANVIEAAMAGILAE